MFEMMDRDGLARICKLEVHGKKVETPLLLPVVNPNVGPIQPRRLQEEFGFHGIITNSFIISRDEQLREKALSDGVHRLLDFDGLIMTDSGTFQEHQYGSIDVDPLEIVVFQRDIGSDIGTILDRFSEPDFSRDKASEAVEKTIERARAAAKIRDEMWLAGPVQGSLFEDLRMSCAQDLSSIDLQLHPIGGVVPLMEDYRFPELVDVIAASKKGLIPSRPVHLFGAGHPMLFPLAVLLGCDLFDSASYAKFARDGRMMFPDGSASIRDMSDLSCQCRVCSKHSPEELKAMESEERESMLAEHNLHVCNAQIRRIKMAIREGTLWELVEQTCRCHPKLLDGLRGLSRHNEFLERYEPLSRRGALLFTGSESYHRPAIWRYQHRLFERYSHPRTEIMIALPESEKPYGRTHAALMAKIDERTNAHFIVLSSIGPVPIELDEIYPVGQFFAPENDLEHIQPETRRLMERFSHEQQYALAVVWESDETLELLESLTSGGGEQFDLDRARVIAVLSIQFGSRAAIAIEGKKLSFIKSRRIGRIRNVFVDDVHAFSIRAHDGYISLTNEGARLLHSALTWPAYRVQITSEAVPFIEKESNVFAKFVVDCDPAIRPGDGVLIVNSDDKLIAHGRSIMNREEMLTFKRGIAVRTRSSITAGKNCEEPERGAIDS